LNLNVNTCWSDEHVAPLLAVQPFDPGPDSIITIGASGFGGAPCPANAMSGLMKRERTK